MSNFPAHCLAESIPIVTAPNGTKARRNPKATKNCMENGLWILSRKILVATGLLLLPVFVVQCVPHGKEDISM